MNKKPLVSVLVPVYGVEKYVGDCVDSIFSQTYKNIEVIFVNDCTPDNSKAIIEEKIKDNPQINAFIIDNPNNIGVASTRNVAIGKSNGEYLCFVDSDDLLPAYAIEVMIKAALSTGADIVRGDIERFSGEMHQPFGRRLPDNDIIEFREALLDWGKYPLGVWGGVYRKSLFEENGLKFFDGLNFGEDFGMTSRLAYYANRVYSVPEIVYEYRINDTSMTQNYTKKNATDIIEISNRIKDFYESNGDFNLYRNALERGRARIKTIMLLQLSPNVSPKYSDVFPDLKQACLPFGIRFKLWAMEHNYRTLYKFAHRIIGPV